MNNLLVSISCITYNHASYIRECLDGFLMQQCNFSFEVLIHDDASTDGTQEIIKEYQEKYPDIIKPIFQVENQYSKGLRGVMARFNFPRAQGKYIALCEGDDYWADPLKLQRQVDFMEENEDYIGCFTNAIVKDKIKNKVYHYNDVYKLKEGVVNNDLIFKYGGGIYPTASLLCRNKIDYNFFINHPKISGDELLIYYLCEKGKLFYFDSATTVYNRDNTGVFSSLIGNNKKMVELRVKEIEGYNGLFSFFNKENQYFLKQKQKEKVLFVLNNSKFKIKYLSYLKYLSFKESIRFFKKLVEKI